MEQQTQTSTQPHWDGRRSGASSSPEYDDIICILHPSSKSAEAATKLIWHSTPDHILQYRKPNLNAEGYDEDDGLEMEGLESQGKSFQQQREPPELDIALRTTARLKNPEMGFIFGREPSKVDIQIASKGGSDTRISGRHFRIWVTEFGVLMLQDISTNGTWVDDCLLHKEPDARRMLNHGSMIKLITGSDRATKSIEVARFIVKLPQRKDDTRYKLNLQKYLLKVEQAKQNACSEVQALVRPDPAGRANIDYLTAGTAASHYSGWLNWGPYNPIGEAGKGAFAIVFKVATVDKGEIFAAKRIEIKHFQKHGKIDGKLYNELEIMKKVRHPHIVLFHEDHMDDKYLYIVMEFAACDNMAPYILPSNLLGEPILRSVTKQLLHALNYIHSNGVVHRDIKPENLLVSSREPFIVKLSDFGLSKMINSNDDQAVLTTFCGTMLYCAPEVYPGYEEMKYGGPRTRRSRGKPKPYSAAVDIWSLGIVLYYLFAAKPPYKGSGEDQGYEMLYAIINDYMDWELMISPIIQPCGRTFLEKMLTVSSEHRPSAKELLTWDWMQGVEDVLPIPMLEETESLTDGPKLETLQEENEVDLGQGNEVDSAWGDQVDPAWAYPVGPGLGNEVGPGLENEVGPDWDNEVDPGRVDEQLEGYEESESFAKAAEGLLPDAEPEVPGLIHDSTSTEGRIIDLYNHTEVRPIEQPSSLQSGKPSTIESFDGSGQAEQGHMEHEDESGINTSSLDNLPENDSVVRPDFLNGQHLHLLPSSYADPDTSNYSQGSNSVLSALEGVNGANLVLSGASRQLPTSTEIAHMAARPAPGPLFGEIPQASPTGESGVFGTTDQPTIRREPESSLGSRRSSSASLSGAEQKMDRLNVRTFNKSSKKAASEPQTKPALKRPHNLSRVTSANDMNPSSSDDEPVLKKSMTAANMSPSASNLSLAEENDFSHSVSQGLTALSLQKQDLEVGTLTPTEGSFSKDTIVLFSRMTMWGRDPGCSHLYANAQDTRVPKQGMDIYFWDTAPAGTIADWADSPNLHAMIMTRSRQGIKVNGIRLGKSPPEGPFKVGKLHTGDVVEVFDDKDGNFLKYTCAFSVGESEKERVPGEKFAIEENKVLYELAAKGRRVRGMMTTRGA